MDRFKRVRNSARTSARAKARRPKDARTPAPYPTPPPHTAMPRDESRAGIRRLMPTRAVEPLSEIHEPEPAPTPLDTWSSLPVRDRAIAGAALAAVAVVGIGIGYVLPRAAAEESTPQPVAGHSAPVVDLDDEVLRPELPVQPVDAPASDADAVHGHEPDVAPARDAARDEIPQPVAAPVVDDVPAPPPAPVVDPAPAPIAEPVAPPAAATYYANCTAVQAAGAAPIFTGEPGYGIHLDRDQDGIGCDT